MTYRVQLPIFEGPLDLLLHLIKKEELDIYDIPIAKITEQYLEHLEVMKLLDLDIAGEFILMAATLIHIKSKMLLPSDGQEEEYIEEADPREELVKRLLEYRKFKEAAGELKDMKLKQADTFTRIPIIERPKVEKFDDGELGFEASLFDLITAFSKVLKEIPKDAFHNVIKDEFSVSDKIHDILHVLVEKKIVNFRSLFCSEDGKTLKSRDEIVSTFLAILELVKLKEIVVMQKDPFGEIELTRHPEWQKK